MCPLIDSVTLGELNNKKLDLTGFMTIQFKSAPVRILRKEIINL